MKHYEYPRKECWEELTKNVKVRLDGKYVIDAETYHGVKVMLLALADKPTVSELCHNCNKDLTDTDKPKDKVSRSLPNTKNKASRSSKQDSGICSPTNNVPTKVLKLQIERTKGDWEDVNDFNYPNNEAWTETGCYSIGLNQFRLIDVTPITTPFKTKPEIEKIEWFGYDDGVFASQSLVVDLKDKINELVERVNLLSTKDKEEGK